MDWMVFTILDRVASEYGPLFCAKNEEVALRQFQRLMREERVENVRDYSLVKIGHFNADSGKLEPLGTNEEIDG